MKKNSFYMKLNGFTHGIFASALIVTLWLTACDLLTDSPDPTLTGITADYTNTATIYPTTPLNSLKTGLTVRAAYSDKTSKTLNAADYTLSGTLAVGTSTVTVTYQDNTTTFNVTVEAEIPAVETVSIADLDDFFLAKPANTPGTPYRIAIIGITDASARVDFFGDIEEAGSGGLRGKIRNWVYDEYSPTNCRYVYIDLSGNTITTLPSGAFMGCSNLTGIKLPDSVTNIANSAFFGCTSLAEITIPSNVTTISEYAFSGCASLTRVTFGGNIPKESITPPITGLSADAFGEEWDLYSKYFAVSGGGPGTYTRAPGGTTWTKQ